MFGCIVNWQHFRLLEFHGEGRDYVFRSVKFQALCLSQMLRSREGSDQVDAEKTYIAFSWGNECRTTIKRERVSVHGSRRSRASIASRPS